MINLIKVVYVNRKLKDANGNVILTQSKKTIPVTIYYLEYLDGKRTPIKPLDNNDYAKLDVLAKVEFNESIKEDKKESK